MPPPSAPSPGWYPDPEGQSDLRWWDGKSWTDLVAERPSKKAAATPESTEPAREPAPLTPVPDPEPEPASPQVVPFPSREPEPEPLPPAAVAPPSAPAPVPAAADAGRRGPRPVVLLLGLLAAAGIAVGAVALTGGEDEPAAVTKAAALPKDCLRVWNTTDTPAAAELRATVARFDPTYARMAHVKPLPGTLMQPGSCALTLYQPDTGLHMTLIAGVKDQLGYIDATTYPRADSLGWPRTKAGANVRVTPEGAVRALAQ